MILSVPETQADAILGAMRAVALEHSPDGMTDGDRWTIAGAATIVLGLAESDPEIVEPRDPEELAATILAEDDARLAVRMLSVMSLVDGRADPEKTALVRSYAEALGVEDGYLKLLTEIAEGEVSAAAACMMRKNIASFPHIDQDRKDAVEAFLPYRSGNAVPDPRGALRDARRPPRGHLRPRILRALQAQRLRVPRQPGGPVRGLHDAARLVAVLSGYSTTQAGEICVSTFIGAMHPDHPMAAEVLPVLYSWHAGIKLSDVAGSYRGAMEPRKFWTAWDRGAATTVDVVDEGWDFWAATEIPLDDLRHQYGVKPVETALLA